MAVSELIRREETLGGLTKRGGRGQNTGVNQVFSESCLSFREADLRVGFSFSGAIRETCFDLP